MAENRNPAAAGDGGSEADHPGRAIGTELAQTPIPNQGAPTLAAHAAVIRLLGKRVVDDVIEIGRLLTECKKVAGHGGWLPWLKREFGWSDKTAERFMAIHRLGMRFDNLSDLAVPVSSLYLLAAPSTPEAACTEVILRAEAGEKVPVEEVKRVIARSKPATRARGGTGRPRSPRSGSRSKLAVPTLNSLVYSEASSKDRREFFSNIGFAAWWNDAPPEFRELARSAGNSIEVDVPQAPSEVTIVKLPTPPTPAGEEDQAADNPMGIPAALKRTPPTDRFGRPRPEFGSLLKGAKK
jgi:hypothetical protein